jgi:hypothetical protein
MKSKIFVVRVKADQMFTFVIGRAGNLRIIAFNDARGYRQPIFGQTFSSRR